MGIHTLTKAIYLFVILGVFTACGGEWNPNRLKFVPENDNEWTLEDLKPIPQAEFDEYVVNNGWKWAGTHKIDENGNCIDKDYYEGLYGGGPSQYYFGKDTYTMFFWADAIPASCFWEQSYSYNEEGNRLISHGSNYFMKILSIDINTLKVIEHLGMLGDGTNIYGYSIYRKMSDEELSECRKNYPTNFEDV